MVTPSEIVDELEQDLMTIAVNMSYEIALTDSKRAIFLRHVKRNVKHLSAVYFSNDECKCRPWLIRDLGRGTEEHAIKVKFISEKLKRGHKTRNHGSRPSLAADVQLPDRAEGAAAQPGGDRSNRLVGG
jgi:hypothetical protein